MRERRTREGKAQRMILQFLMGDCMGDIDNQTLDYMANKYRFADAFNFYMHGGKML